MNRAQRRSNARVAARSPLAPRAQAHASTSARLDAAFADFERGDLAAAERGCRAAIAVAPRHARALHLLGVVLAQAGRDQEAAVVLERACDAAPEDATAQYHLGNALRVTAGPLAAAEHYTRALAIDPGYAQGHNGLGNVLRQLGDLDGAAASYLQAIELAPTLPDPHHNLAMILEARGELSAAVAAVSRAYALGLRTPELFNNRGSLLMKLGRIDEAEQALRQAIALRPQFAAAHSNLLLCLHYRPYDHAATFEEHRAWQERQAAVVPALPPRALADDPGRRLRIGYVTPDLGGHPVGSFIRPLLEAHDRSCFDVTCYIDSGHAAACADWLRALPDRWRDVNGLADEAVAQLVREDAIDILVDLAGHTAHHRLLAFARRPAPVQVTYCGYPDTTGMDAIDYRISDERADPAGMTEAYHSETLVRLPGPFLCYQPPTNAPAPAARPFLAGAPFTFGSFAHLPKINAAVVALWSGLLQAVPGSRMLIKALALVEDDARQTLRDTFAAHGVGAERVELVGWTATHAEHMALYAGIDVVLDTFPYAGATTTCEALWMGVPVVTLAGRTHVARVGVSLLNAVGLDELVADTPEQYVAIAVALANDHDGLGALCAGLRDRMAASPLCDGARLAGEVEDAYRGMWRAAVEQAEQTKVVAR